MRPVRRCANGPYSFKNGRTPSNRYGKHGSKDELSIRKKHWERGVTHKQVQTFIVAFLPAGVERGDVGMSDILRFGDVSMSVGSA